MLSLINRPVFHITIGSQIGIDNITNEIVAVQFSRNNNNFQIILSIRNAFLFRFDRFINTDVLTFGYCQRLCFAPAPHQRISVSLRLSFRFQSFPTKS